MDQHPSGEHAAEPPRSDPPALHRVTRYLSAAAGSMGAAALVLIGCLAWTAVGATSGFPRWWELVATIGLPFVTLLMVVLLQHTQNHDTRATHLKLDELIRSTETATNRMMTVEDATPGDLDRIQDDFRSQASGRPTATPAAQSPDRRDRRRTESTRP